MSRRRSQLVAVLLLAVAGGGCGTDDPEPAARTAPTPTTTAAHAATETASPTPPTSAPATEDGAAPRPRPRRVLGIDISHHQGDIDWRRVAGDGIAFAYLKATEGSTFTDPRFAENHAAATDAGLRVGGYHYYTLCSEPAPQADHFTATLDALPDAAPPPRGLPPVVDLELLGNCDPPPDGDVLLADVRDFVARVEAATGRRVVVYTHPDFDARYDLAERLDRRRWVRRPGDVAPPGEWWLWQRADDAAVAGVDGPVDLDVMRQGRRPAR